MVDEKDGNEVLAVNMDFALLRAFVVKYRLSTGGINPNLFLV